MQDTLDLAGLQVEVTRKAIRHVHLSVLPPDGRVRVAAPHGTALETLRLFVISRLVWIRAQQRKMQAQERETPRDFLGKESHYLWGKRYLLDVRHADAAPAVNLTPRQLQLQIRPGTTPARCAEVLEAWYRQQVRAALPALLERWEPRLGVKAGRVFVQRMKTKWGSCTPATGSIRLNTDLARKPPECLEYIVVHELTHLIVPTHDARFSTVLDQHLPHWRQVRERLNRLPVRHEVWEDRRATADML